MNAILSERKQRLISLVLALAGTFLGFQALSLTLRLYQLTVFAWLSLVIYCFHFFWLTFMFDLHLKNRGNLVAARLMNLKGLRLLRQALMSRIAHLIEWKYFRHYVNFLILPGLLYWSTVVMLMLNPFRVQFKQAVIALSTASLAFSYMYFKRVFHKRMEHHEEGLKLLAIAKLYCAYLCLSSVFGLTVYFGLDGNFLAVALIFVTFILIYQALFQHGLLNFMNVSMTVAAGLAVALMGVLLFQVWDSNYLTAGLMLAAGYNLCWGLIHHFSDKNLTKVLVMEYLFMTVLIVSLLLVTHDFRIRIG